MGYSLCLIKNFVKVNPVGQNPWTKGKRVHKHSTGCSPSHAFNRVQKHTSGCNYYLHTTGCI